MNQSIVSVIRSLGYLPDREDPSDVHSRLSRSAILSGKLPQSTVGLRYLDNVFPHRFKARTAGCPSLHEAFNDDRHLWRAIDYVVSTGREPDRDVVLRNLQFNVKVPSHFFPDSASALCRSYAPGGDVYDAFTGWGGRALGAICAGASSLVSTDLQAESSESGRRMSSDFSKLSSTRCEFLTEDFAHYVSSTDRRFDLVLASPPFLDTEDYGGGGRRSVRDWSTSVAVPLARSARRILKAGGRIAVHGQDRASVPVLSLLYTAFTCAGFDLEAEYRYGKTAGQSVLIWRWCRGMSSFG